MTNVDVTRRSSTSKPPSWTGLAAIVESMFLLLFVVASLAILIQLFVASTGRARQGHDLARAVSAATEMAEVFAQDPEASAGTETIEGLSVSCDVTSEEHEAGTLYHAHIQVQDPDGEGALYELTTARYVKEGQDG